MGSDVEQAASAFAEELARWREARGYSKKNLAARMGFDPSYLSHVERLRHRPTELLARRADDALNAKGAILLKYQRYVDARLAISASGLGLFDTRAQWASKTAAPGLLVEHEHAALSLYDKVYHYTVKRRLYNAGVDPITRFPVRLMTDRFPNDPERSNKHHYERPLTWSELELHAYYGDPATREPMDWRPQTDRTADKEVWLLFRNSRGLFPLYPRHRTTIEYHFTVGDDKWGPWFERDIRVPTRHLEICLFLPRSLGTKLPTLLTTLSNEPAPFPTPVSHTEVGDMIRHEWSTDNPIFQAQYRISWPEVDDKTSRPDVGDKRPYLPVAVPGR